MEFISERVSMEQRADGLSVVISARLSRAKETLLVSWVLAWSVCGILIAVEMASLPAGRMRTYLIVFLVFWAWVAVRIGRATLWRLKGFELWRIKDGRLTVKDSILGFGRANDYFVEIISRFGPLAIDESSWKWQLNDSFWVMGAERIGFECAGKKVAIGKGLTREEAERLVRVMTKALTAARKKAQ